MDIRLRSLLEAKAAIAHAWLGTPAVDAALGSIVLAPHQVAAAARLVRIVGEFGGALLADEVGLGKTYTALAVARAFRSVHVVMPASLREMWSDALARAAQTAELTALESLSRARSTGPRSELVIVDEAHQARNPRTRRYRALARLTVAARVLLVSATPIHNHPRDLRSQLALFLGARAFTLGDADLARLIVRRGPDVWPAGETGLPKLVPTQWLTTENAPMVVRAIARLPAPVATADGGVAHALLRLALLRGWASSHATLRVMLRRRLLRAAALRQALESGRLPTRRELMTWAVVDDSVQLAFPELVSAVTSGIELPALLRTIEAHDHGLRDVLLALGASHDADADRVAWLRWLRAGHPGARIVAFTQFAQTARAMFEQLRRDAGVAMVTASGARIASGKIARGEIVRRFARAADDRLDRRLPLDLLITTDVLSEGLNLQGASVVVHLDLPWTVARVEQRIGRIRRLGSPHDRVYVYAIGPPPRGRTFSAVVRALQRKLGVVTSLVGDATLADHCLLLGERGSAASRKVGRAGLVATNEALRQVFASWVSNHAPMHSRKHRLVLAVAAGESTAQEWQALAAGRVNGRVTTTTLAPNEICGAPEATLRMARLLDGAQDVEIHDHACSADHRAALYAAHDAAERWLAGQRAALLAAPAANAPSAEHARALRWIDSLHTKLARHDRVALSELAVHCRRLVLLAQGAGAETMLAEWLETHGAPGVSAPRASLETFARYLEEHGIVLRRDGEDDNATLIALVVLVRA